MICSIDRYRAIAHDDTTIDSTIYEALANAQKLVESKTDRFFELRDEDGDPIVRTETLRVFSDGRFYPHASPVVSVVSPPEAAPVAASIVAPEWQYFGLSPWVILRGQRQASWSGAPTPIVRALVTYTGGYETDEMPEEIVQVVAALAQRSLENKVAFSEIPAGATSVHVGDVSFAGKDLGMDTSYPSSITRVLNKWRYRNG